MEPISRPSPSPSSPAKIVPSIETRVGAGATKLHDKTGQIANLKFAAEVAVAVGAGAALASKGKGGALFKRVVQRVVRNPETAGAGFTMTPRAATKTQKVMERAAHALGTAAYVGGVTLLSGGASLALSADSLPKGLFHTHLHAHIADHQKEIRDIRSTLLSTHSESRETTQAKLKEEMLVALEKLPEGEREAKKGEIEGQIKLYMELYDKGHAEISGELEQIDSSLRTSLSKLTPHSSATEEAIPHVGTAFIGAAATLLAARLPAAQFFLQVGGKVLSPAAIKEAVSILTNAIGVTVQELIKKETGRTVSLEDVAKSFETVGLPFVEKSESSQPTSPSLSDIPLSVGFKDAIVKLIVNRLNLSSVASGAADTTLSALLAKSEKTLSVGEVHDTIREGLTPLREKTAALKGRVTKLLVAAPKTTKVPTSVDEMVSKSLAFLPPSP